MTEFLVKRTIAKIASKSLVSNASEIHWMHFCTLRDFAHTLGRNAADISACRESFKNDISLKDKNSTDLHSGQIFLSFDNCKSVKKKWSLSQCHKVSQFSMSHFRSLIVELPARFKASTTIKKESVLFCGKQQYEIFQTLQNVQQKARRR